VTAQSKVSGLPESKRAFIPKDGPKDFLDSHYTKNHGWVLDFLPGNKGYVKKRD